MSHNQGLMVRFETGPEILHDTTSLSSQHNGPPAIEAHLDLAHAHLTSISHEDSFTGHDYLQYPHHPQNEQRESEQGLAINDTFITSTGGDFATQPQFMHSHDISNLFTGGSEGSTGSGNGNGAWGQSLDSSRPHPDLTLQASNNNYQVSTNSNLWQAQQQTQQQQPSQSLSQESIDDLLGYVLEIANATGGAIESNPGPSSGTANKNSFSLGLASSSSRSSSSQSDIRASFTDQWLSSNTSALGLINATTSPSSMTTRTKRANSTHDRKEPKRSNYSLVHEKISVKPSDVGNVYLYPDASPEVDLPADKLDLSLGAYSNPLQVHKQVSATIKDEFDFQKHYEHKLSQASGKKGPGKTANFQIMKKIRKRRDPRKDDNIWEPESIYKAYTNCKPKYFDKSDYPNSVPLTSCFGRINMRVKGAWTRSQNRSKRS